MRSFRKMSGRSAATATVRAVKRRLIPTKAALSLTPTAVNRIKLLLMNQPGSQGLRIGVRQRGCNGLSYTLDYAEKKEKFDEEVVQEETAPEEVKSEEETEVVESDMIREETFTEVSTEVRVSEPVLTEEPVKAKRGRKKKIA